MTEYECTQFERFNFGRETKLNCRQECGEFIECHFYLHRISVVSSTIKHNLTFSRVIWFLNNKKAETVSRMLRKKQSKFTVESQSEEEQNSANEVDEEESENEQMDENVSENDENDEDQSEADQMDVAAGPSGMSEAKPPKKRKRGIIYISSIPKHMSVMILREMLNQYAKIDRIFLQPGKVPGKLV